MNIGFSSFLVHPWHQPCCSCVIPTSQYHSYLYTSLCRPSPYAIVTCVTISSAAFTSHHCFPYHRLVFYYHLFSHWQFQRALYHVVLSRSSMSQTHFALHCPPSLLLDDAMTYLHVSAWHCISCIGLMQCGWHRYMKLCHTREELARLPQGPKLVLATLPSLQAGCARDLFLEWAPDPKNLILCTQQAEVRLSTIQQGSTYLWSPPAC